jgi:arylsulfatase
MAKRQSAKTPKRSIEANGQDAIPRHMLPIPDVTPITLTTFDAKDPDTKYPPIRQLRPPHGRA